jgi:hypothetical protein
VHCNTPSNSDEVIPAGFSREMLLTGTSQRKMSQHKPPHTALELRSSLHALAWGSSCLINKTLRMRGTLILVGFKIVNVFSDGTAAKK